MDINLLIFTIAKSAPGFLFAVVVHEWAHGYMAKRFGDLTAERAGRLTFNPTSHIDPFGTILFPLMCVVIGLSMGGGAMAFGWAKPVPINESNFSNRRKGLFWVSFAGALANLIVGSISALLLVINYKHFGPYGLQKQVHDILEFSVTINFILAGFNLIPLPPLDGSKMVSSFLKGETLRKYEGLAQYTSYIFLAAIALSFMGINTIGYLLLPFQLLAQLIVGIFSAIL